MSRPFLFSLTVATLIHLLGASLFHIQPFIEKDTLHDLPTAWVTSEVTHTTVEPFAIEETRQKLQKLLQTQPKGPSPSEFLTPLLSRPIFSAALLQQQSNCTKVPRVQVLVTGALATIPFVVNELPTEQVDSSRAKQTCLCYDVRVDMRSGKIFWYQLLQSEGYPTGNEENFLEKFLFQKDELMPIARGVIELITTEEAKP